LLVLALVSPFSVIAQKLSHNGIQLRKAYNHGYRAGYADGYNAGKHDFAGRINRDYRQHTLYQGADRGYQSRLGPLVDYKEGYTLDFEVAYFDGYTGRAFDSRIPPNIAHPGRKIVPVKTNPASGVPNGMAR